MKKRKINLYLVLLFSMVFLVVANTTELNLSNITKFEENYTPDIIGEIVLANITFETNISIEIDNATYIEKVNLTENLSEEIYYMKNN